MFGLLLDWDKILTLVLKNIFPANRLFNTLFSFFSLKGNSVLIWVLIAGITIYMEERKNPGISSRDKKFTFYFFSSILATSLITMFVFKGIFHRPRPYVEFNFSNVSRTCPVDFSFPSAHAATAFAAASILTCFDKRRRLFYYLIALMIAYSRIYLGCHFLFDIVGGALLGWTVSKTVIYFSSKKPWLKNP